MIDETQQAMRRMPRIAALLREIGPYAAIELVLPGGSLIAPLIWLYRRNDTVRSAIPRCLAAISRTIRASWGPIHAEPADRHTTRSPACA